MAIEVSLGSNASVRELLELLEVIESTRLQDSPETWRDRTSRSINYHRGRSEHGGDFCYYDQWSLQKIDQQTANYRAAATRTNQYGLKC